MTKKAVTIWVCVTKWVLLFIISKNYFLIKKTASVIYQILVTSENDANKEEESATLRRQNLKKQSIEHASPKSYKRAINF